MRRILVIFLILLFPLNVLALSMSASAAQHDGAQGQAMAALCLDAAQDAEARADVDPDEPPSAPDLHDLVDQERASHLAIPCAGAAARHDPARLGHAFPPPVKPPRRA